MTHEGTPTTSITTAIRGHRVVRTVSMATRYGATPLEHPELDKYDDLTDDPIPDETEEGEVTEVDPEPGEPDDPVTQEPVEED